MSLSSTDPTRLPPAVKLQYYGGASVLHGVEPLNASTFKDLYNSYFLAPVVISHTREDYHKAPPEQQKKMKQVAFVTAGVFPGKGKRLKADITHCSLVCIDVDVSDEARPLAERPEIIANAFPWNFIAYHTLSSTQAEPRIRVIVDAPMFPMEHYTKAVHHICDTLGLVTRNAESLDCSRPMYRPTACLTANRDAPEDTPCLAVRLDGRPMPLEEFITYTIPDDLGDFMPLTRNMGVGTVMIVPNVTEDQARHVLSFIDPDVHYNMWTQVMRGLRHQFSRNPEDAEIGFNLCDEWSSKGSKYEGYDKVRHKWKSFAATPASGEKPVTFRTVQYLAAAAGWKDTVGAEEALNTFKVLIERSLSPAELTTSIIQEIAEEVRFNETQRSILLQLTRQRLGVLKFPTSISDLKRELHRAQREIAAEVNAARTTMPQWLAGWIYVASTHTMVRAGNPATNITLEAFNVMHHLDAMPDGGEQEVLPTTIMKNHPSFPRVIRQEYNPERAQEGIYSDNGEMVMNTYRFSCPEFDPDGADEAGALLLEHTANMFPDPRSQRILLSFFAYMVQQPGKKIKWAPFIQGTQGCGKSLYADIMSAVIGATNVTMVDKLKLESNYNDWAGSTQLLVFDEILTGDDKKKTMERLKPLITQSVMGLSRKYHDSRDVVNRTNAIFLSNYDEGIRVDDDERRYLVLRSAYQNKSQVEALPKDYFSRLFTLTGPLAGATRHFLANYPLDPEFDPNGAAPRTGDWDRIVNVSRNEIEYSIQTIIGEDTEPLIHADMLSVTQLRVAIHGRAGRAVSDKSLYAALAKLGFIAWGQASIFGHRHRIWIHRDYELMLGAPDTILRERQNFDLSGEINLQS
jgi:hypothetical protein